MAPPLEVVPALGDWYVARQTSTQRVDKHCLSVLNAFVGRRWRSFWWRYLDVYWRRGTIWYVANPMCARSEYCKLTETPGGGSSSTNSGGLFGASTSNPLAQSTAGVYGAISCSGDHFLTLSRFLFPVRWNEWRWWRTVWRWRWRDWWGRNFRWRRIPTDKVPEPQLSNNHRQ